MSKPTKIYRLIDKLISLTQDSALATSSDSRVKLDEELQIVRADLIGEIDDAIIDAYTSGYAARKNLES